MTISDITATLYSEIVDKVGEQAADIAVKTLMLILKDYDITKKITTLTTDRSDKNQKMFQMFFITKKTEGCTNETLTYYSTILRKFFNTVQKDPEFIVADDIRVYLAMQAIEKNVSKCTQNNELHVLKSFYKWAFAEGYVTKMPTLNVKSIKQEKRIKEPFSETEIEKMRRYLIDLPANTDREREAKSRDLAILDTLLSTGVRVSELVGMRCSQIRNDEITVFGKGEKERVVFLNAKALLSINTYLTLRKDDNDALFVASVGKRTCLAKGSVETLLRNLGKECNVPQVHPHRFRRTAATFALNRGMDIEQVAQMLGHAMIQTTTIYARSSKENLKASHRKYLT